jgi:hypothetical protein
VYTGPTLFGNPDQFQNEDKAVASQPAGRSIKVGMFMGVADPGITLA